MLLHLRDKAPKKQKSHFEVMGDGVQRYRGRLFVLDVAVLLQQIMAEAHYSGSLIHSRSTKMYHDIKEIYWWNDMKNDIVQFIAQCPNCQQVKVEHQNLGGLLQDVP